MRLEGGDGRCAGGVEMKHQEEWRRVGSWSDWGLRAAVVVCRQLDCGSAVSTRFTVGDDKHDAWEFRSHCVGSESALRECGTVEERYSTSSTLEVICSGNTHIMWLYSADDVGSHITNLNLSQQLSAHYTRHLFTLC